MIRLITLPLGILQLPAYDAAALLGNCFAIRESATEQRPLEAAWHIWRDA
jgi:hypothetical protein